MARTRVARTRLTQDEYDEFVAAPASEAGVTPAEYLRSLIVSNRSLEARITSIENRLLNVEAEVARMWSQEDRQHDQQST